MGNGSGYGTPQGAGRWDIAVGPNSHEGSSIGQADREEANVTEEDFGDADLRNSDLRNSDLGNSEFWPSDQVSPSLEDTRTRRIRMRARGAA
jgi:uncharacterized protein YjbI with pentapeptide repeats